VKIPNKNNRHPFGSKEIYPQKALGTCDIHWGKRYQKRSKTLISLYMWFWKENCPKMASICVGELLQFTQIHQLQPAFH